MKKMRLSILFLGALLFASCATVSQTPPPAQPQPEPAQATGPQFSAPATSTSADKERAKALVQGGYDAGAVIPAPATPAPAATTAPVASSTTAPASTASAPVATAPASVDQPVPPPGQMTPEEAAYLTNYLARLNYMVYYNEEAKIDPRMAKIAITQANRYLIEKQGLSVIDFDQIEKNKKDQQSAYQAETGGSIDLVQYLAQKFNADVYVEIDVSVSTETRDSKFYASAQGSMKIFDTSTASLLGSVAFMAQPAFSPTSADAAVSNAIAGSIWNAMPKMTSQAKELIKNSLGRGVRYELVVQKTPDSRMMSQFRRALGKKLREVEQVSYSPNETKLNIYTFQGRDKVEDAIYDAAAASGLNDMNLVYMRGKSFTFNTGL